MAKKLFSFDTTSEDEPEFFANIMEQHNIAFYVVPGTAFGLSKPSFWIKNDNDFAKANELFRRHEQEYAALAREKYQRETGYNPAATGRDKFQFLASHLSKKRKTVLWIVITLGLVILYFVKFYSALFQ